MKCYFGKRHYQYDECLMLSLLMISSLLVSILISQTIICIPFFLILKKILGDFLWFIFKPQNCESPLVPNCFILQYTTCSNNVNAIIIIKFCYQLFLRKVLLASGYLNSNIANSSFQQQKRGQNDPLRSVMNFIKAFKLISKTCRRVVAFIVCIENYSVVRYFSPFLQPTAYCAPI